MNLGLSHKTKVSVHTHYKKVSSIMIHFGTASVSVSVIHFGPISIINHWYMTVIHLLEFRTLLARFAKCQESHISQFILEVRLLLTLLFMFQLNGTYTCILQFTFWCFLYVRLLASSDFSFNFCGLVRFSKVTAKYQESWYVLNVSAFC